MFKRYGLPVSTAMQNDVNGVAWCLADYLPDLGVRYLTMGSNNHRALIPFEGPTVYKWESPSGKSLFPTVPIITIPATTGESNGATWAFSPKGCSPISTN